jgi:hypothetical protein
MNFAPPRLALLADPPLAGKDQTAGRVCPIDYTYSPAVFARAPEVEAETLYVVGGLYGNLAALEAIETLAAQESTPPTIVFNGDYHWFDAEPAWFEAIEHGVARHRALRGNVESEVARASDIGAGCGCAYPESVSGDVVTRSNEILTLLQKIASPEARVRFSKLPMHLVAEISGLRVGIVHGDAAALAGWRFAQDRLDDPNEEWLADIQNVAGVDAFASTHTCLAALRDFCLPGGNLAVVNNGAAGMPNFTGSRYGIITRFAATPCPHPTLYGLQRNGVFIDALAVNYDHAAFLAQFLKRWPHGSPAYESYYSRIVDGPNYTLAQAQPPA